jgi:hypothetical protein
MKDHAGLSLSIRCPKRSRYDGRKGAVRTTNRLFVRPATRDDPGS